MAKSKSKITGTASELRFAVECVERGAIVCQPFGGDAQYDFLVDSGTRIFRVQVKTASPKAAGKSFVVNLQRKMPGARGRVGASTVAVPYENGAVDCIVTWAGSAWFFFPDAHLLPSTETIYPDNNKEYRGNRGRERWELIGLRPESNAERTRDKKIFAERLGPKMDD